GYYDPINHPDHAIKRRNLVLNAMLEDGRITAQAANDAKAKPVQLNLQHDLNALAPYYVEEIRRYLESKYGTDQVHEGGLRVYTTPELIRQKAANQSWLEGLAAYERRHGWKAKLRSVLALGIPVDKYQHPDWYDEVEVNGYVHALVTAVSPESAAIRFGRYTA